MDWEVCGEAVDGFDAVQKNRALKPHFIVMDLSMPRMSGMEAAREILKEFPNVLILLLTLYHTRQVEDMREGLGFERHCQKPHWVILWAT